MTLFLSNIIISPVYDTFGFITDNVVMILDTLSGCACSVGLAFIGSMCRGGGDSVSVVEDHGGFQNIATAAHEIGHR